MKDGNLGAQSLDFSRLFEDMRRLHWLQAYPVQDTRRVFHRYDILQFLDPGCDACPYSSLMAEAYAAFWIDGGTLRLNYNFLKKAIGGTLTECSRRGGDLIEPNFVDKLLLGEHAVVAVDEIAPTFFRGVARELCIREDSVR